MNTSLTLAETLVPLMRATSRFADMSPEACIAYAQPFCNAGQAIIARTEKGGVEGDPFGFAFWARVDDTGDAILRDPKTDMRDVGFAGLNDGPHAWMVEVVCQPSHLQALLKSGAASVFPNETVHARLLDENGQGQTVKVDV